MNTTPRSRLLLVELICDLIIFALCAVVCVALLVNARVLSRESTQLTQAVYVAQSAAETYLSGGDGGGIYRPDGTRASSATEPDALDVIVDQGEDGTKIHVFPVTGGAPIYTLTVKGGS